MSNTNTETKKKSQKEVVISNPHIDAASEATNDPAIEAAKPQVEIKIVEKIVEKIVYRDAPVAEVKDTTPNVDFLRNEIVTIQYIKKPNDFIKDPKHVGYGGLFEGSAIAIPPPLMDSGKMKNLLTDKEKKGLEFLLGMDLSIYKDFWKQEYSKGSVFPIFLGKDDTRLDLSDPMQYIIWKVLLASPIVANSMDEIRNKATYRFVMVAEGEKLRKEKDAVGAKIMAFELYVTYKKDKSVLRYILRNLGKYTTHQQGMDFIQVEAAKLAESQSDLFVSITADEHLKSKVLIEECVEFGVINRIDGKLYTKDNDPISGGETPTMDIASKYLSSPLGTDIKFSLEAKLKIAKN